MTITTIDADEDHSQYVGQVYQEHYPRLRHYFLVQLGDPSEADDLVQETMRHFFFFMEDRHWEGEAEYVPAHLMKIAGLLCSRKLAEKRSRRAADLGDIESNGLLNKIRAEAVRTIKERMEFKRVVLSPVAGNGR
jgi:hypothetical protein